MVSEARASDKHPQDSKVSSLPRVDGGHLMSAHHALIYLGLHGAHSESFLLGRLSFYLERYQDRSLKYSFATSEYTYRYGDVCQTEHDPERITRYSADEMTCH